MAVKVLNITSSNYGNVSGDRLDIGYNDTTSYTIPGTTWTVQLTPTFTDIRIGNFDTPGTGDASWVAGVELSDRGRIAATAAVFTISGLDDAKTYTLYGLSSSSVSGRSSAWTVNGGGTVQEVPDEIAGVNNNSESAIFTGVSPVSGVITLEVKKAASSSGDSYVAAAAIEEEASAGDTTPPTFDTAPNVTATTETGHSIAATLNEAGTIYGVRLANGATAPTSAQVKAGQDSTGSAAPEAKSSAAANSATLVFSTGSASTAYDYYIVAEDDEGTPNVQASPTLVEATTAAAQVPGISAITVQKDGVAVQTADWVINISLVSDGTEVYPETTVSSDASGVISAINTDSGSVGDAVIVEGFSSSNNYGFKFTQNLDDNA